LRFNIALLPAGETRREPAHAQAGRTIRLAFFRGHGRDFSERDRALLTLLRPHLHRAYLIAERRRHPTPQLIPGSGSCRVRSPLTRGEDRYRADPGPQLDEAGFDEQGAARVVPVASRRARRSARSVPPRS
jgi:hypothetical protein